MPSWTVPSDSHAVGDTGHTADHDHIADDLTLIATAFPGVTSGVGSLAPPSRTVTSSTNATATDCLINVNATSGALTVTLPSVTGQTYLFVITKTDSSAHAVTVATTGGQTFAGVTSSTLTAQNQSIVLMGDGSNWQVWAGAPFQTYSGISVSGESFLGQTQFFGVVQPFSGFDTSNDAAASSQSFTTATSKQLSTTQDVVLYISVVTTGTYTIAFGPTSTPANTLINGKSLAAGQLVTVYVPKGWYAEITGTIANLTITQVTM